MQMPCGSHQQSNLTFSHSLDRWWPGRVLPELCHARRSAARLGRASLPDNEFPLQLVLCLFLIGRLLPCTIFRFLGPFSDTAATSVPPVRGECRNVRSGAPRTAQACLHRAAHCSRSCRRAPALPACHRRDVEGPRQSRRGTKTGFKEAAIYVKRRAEIPNPILHPSSSSIARLTRFILPPPYLRAGLLAAGCATPLRGRREDERGH